jgi:hypothetical protein
MCRQISTTNPTTNFSVKDVLGGIHGGCWQATYFRLGYQKQFCRSVSITYSAC